MCTPPMHSPHLTSALVTDTPTHSRWLKLRHKTDFHLTWQRSAAERCREWSRQRALKIPQQQHQHPQHRHGHRSRHGQFQQQLKQEKTDVIQKLRTELSETVNGRLDMMNSISIAMQRVTANPVPKPYSISGLIPKNLGREQ